MKLTLLTLTGMLAATIASAQNGFSGPGLYEIMNLKTSRMMALDLKDQSSVIQIASRGQEEEQRWVVEQGPNGVFLIRSAVNGRALQITNKAKSTPVVCGPLDPKNAGQLWRFEPASDGNTQIVNVAGGRVLDIPNGSDKEGLRIQIYDRNGNPNQRFIFHRVDEPQDRDRQRRARWGR